jgi:hypothetical protein
LGPDFALGNHRSYLLQGSEFVVVEHFHQHSFPNLNNLQEMSE